MGVIIHGVVLKDDVDVVVDVCGRSLHVSDGVAHILGGYEVVRVHNGSGGQIVHDPVVVVLPFKNKYRVIKTYIHFKIYGSSIPFDGLFELVNIFSFQFNLT